MGCDDAAVTPVLLFDGDCAFCSSLARLVGTRLRPAHDRYAISPYQRWDLASVGLTEQDCAQALQWVSTSGRVLAAQDAVAQLLLASRWWVRPLGAALLLPGVHALAGVAYRWVSRNRHRLPGGTPACSVQQPAPDAP